MIPQNTLDEVRRLLHSKVSYRKIAKVAGVSRGSVSLIASGKRADYVERERRRSEEDLGPSGPFVRCACGHKVQLPCQICRARYRRAHGDERPRAERGETRDDLHLQLDDEHRVRYEEIRRRRANEEAT